MTKPFPEIALTVMLPPDYLSEFDRDAAAVHAATGRPLVLLSFAQSLDGSLAVTRGSALQLSGPESSRITHRLRAASDAILVGIGTLLSDDPRLSARGVEGGQPRPVVLDTHLRTPTSARVLAHEKPPWIFSSPHADRNAHRTLEVFGAGVHQIPTGQDGFLDLAAALDVLGRLGIRSLMVEGGARVIGSFLKSGLVDRAAITIVPLFVGGLRTLEQLLTPFPALADLRYVQAGRDVVVFGDIEKGR